MDFRPSEEQEILRRSVREFAEAEIRPHVMEWDEAQHFPMELLPKLADLGLMGIQFDERYGGSAMSAVDYCICIEELARVCPAIALSVAAHNGLCTSHINMFGSEAQKSAYLPRLVKGEVLGAWGLTEAGAGSDAAGMRTTAVRQPLSLRGERGRRRRHSDTGYALGLQDGPGTPNAVHLHDVSRRQPLTNVGIVATNHARYRNKKIRE